MVYDILSNNCTQILWWNFRQASACLFHPRTCFCVVQVLGRNVRDFINELDNLHEYFRFSFPKVQPPSFCVEEECETSLTLHYRSTRKGFTQFVKGKHIQKDRLQMKMNALFQ